MLALRQAEAQGRVREEEAWLARVAARLRSIEQEGTMPRYEVVLKRVAPLAVASARTVAPTIGDMDRFCRAIGALVDGADVRKTGVWMNIYHHEGFRTADLDVEAAVPIDPATAADLTARTDGRVGVRTLPEVPTVASLTFGHGPEALVPARRALGAWIDDNGCAITGPCREVYVGEADSPESNMLEIRFLVVTI